jgi:neutral ceramidase
MELQALRVNELGIVAIPAEPFVEIGLAIRAHAGTSPMFPVGHANGYFTYLPWPDAYGEGGYEVDETWKGRLSAGPAPEAARVVVEACVQLLEETGAGPDFRPT